MNIYSQENKTLDEVKKAPFSIYTEGLSIFNNETDASANFLSFNDFKFLFVDQENIERNIFTIDFRNIGRKASTYDYQSYRKADLNKYFEVVPDIVVLNRFSNSSLPQKN